MGKLITPVQYEPAVDGLNIGKPLDLADETRQELSLPILNQNPVDKIKLPRGKFLQVDNQGALLVRNSGCYKNVIERSAALDTLLETRTLDFGRVVEYISVLITGFIQAFGVSFYDSNFITAWKSILIHTSFHGNYHGRYLYAKGSGGDPWVIEFTVYGFY